MNDPDDLPIFRPRMGRRQKPTTRLPSPSFRGALLSRLGRGARGARARSRVAVPRPRADARRVVVKAHVVRMNASGAKAAVLHFRYIERDGVEKDGSKGVLYGADGPVRAEAFEQPRPGEKHQFRFIVSPEDAADLDLTAYVRRLMVQVAQDLGRKLEWAAVNHHDTEHPHAHIVLRGVDRDGREVRLDRGYIAHGLRGRAQAFATEELGPRLERDIQRAYIREVDRDRFTSLDRELERRAKDGRVEARSPQGLGRIDESLLVARLEHLEGMRLATRLSRTAWSLGDEWQAHLRELGSRGDILKEMHAALKGDPARYRIVRPGQALDASGDAQRGRVAFGRVASKGLSDELKGTFYAILETPTGQAYHVPLDAPMAADIRPGDLVSFRSEPEAAVRAVDRRIAEVAATHGGVCAVAPSPSADRAPDEERRLRDLEKLGLATREAPSRWKVSPNLLQELERRHLETPARHRLRIRKERLSLQAQVHHPGPVWLDRIDATSLAPFGFGAELRRSVQERQDALHQLGIAPGARDQAARLREIQRRVIGEQFATRCGQTFLPSMPEPFRGRVQPPDVVGVGGSYAVVSDGARFVVLHRTSALGSLQGKAVTVTYDAKGRLRVRPRDNDLGT